MPPAPPRLSLMTCWPMRSPSFCPTSRAMMSVDPPGGKATISRTGLVGYAACANAATGSTASSAPAATTCNCLYMGSSSLLSLKVPRAPGPEGLPAAILLDGRTRSHPLSGLCRLSGRLLALLAYRWNDQDQQQHHGRNEESCADRSREEHRRIAARYQQRPAQVLLHERAQHEREDEW